MELIQTITLTSAQSTIEFTSIPQDATDLRLVFSAREATLDNVAARVLVNGATTNLSQRFLFGTGSSTGSAGDSFFDVYINYNSSTANTFGNGEVYVANYASTTTSKSLSTDAVTENNASSAFMRIGAGLYNSNTAITSLGIQAIGGNLAIGTSASLYKIRRFNTPTQPKATGGVISYDAVNNKWVHVFTASGTFTPTQNLTGVEYLVVAGGGGGGKGLNSAANNSTGGGGAGGYRSSVIGELSGGNSSAEATMSLTASTNYAVVVGSGGAGGASQVTAGANGSNSSFNGITALGGGGGAPGESGTKNGASGGSGGGSAGSGGTGGAGTTGQGFAGATSSGSFVGAGGGGAAEAGNTDGLRTGGDGLASSITGRSVFRAGGGGSGTYANTGGAGGDGGGGAGSENAGPAGSGTANTGGGGGGLGCDAGGNTGTPGAGGSGIVIVRYS